MRISYSTQNSEMEVRKVLSGETMAMLQSLLPFFLMGGIFYFMLWKPQKKEQQRRDNMLNSLKRGDAVYTIGGICGVITCLSEKTVTLKVAENVEMKFLRTAVSGVQDSSCQDSKCQCDNE